MQCNEPVDRPCDFRLSDSAAAMSGFAAAAKSRYVTGKR